jgi:hypothetical protein
VNVLGVAHGVQAFVPRMIASGEEGFVMNTSSGDGGISPLAQQVVYASSKAAVSTMTECLGAQLEGRGTQLRAAIFYPSGGMLNTGIWTTKRNRPAELARSTQVDAARETTFDDFMEGARKAGWQLPVQDLDELAQFAIAGIRRNHGEAIDRLGRAGVGAALAACEAVHARKVRNAFVCSRPPGHHARNDGEVVGFCLYNNVAVAARQRLAGSHRKSNTAHRQQRKRELVRLLMRKDEG